jgi:hypothetical protein
VFASGISHLLLIFITQNNIIGCMANNVERGSPERASTRAFRPLDAFVNKVRRDPDPGEFVAHLCGMMRGFAVITNDGQSLTLGELIDARHTEALSSGKPSGLMIRLEPKSRGLLATTGEVLNNESLFTVSFRPAPTSGPGFTLGYDGAGPNFFVGCGKDPGNLHISFHQDPIIQFTTGRSEDTNANWAVLPGSTDPTGAYTSPRLSIQYSGPLLPHGKMVDALLRDRAQRAITDVFDVLSAGASAK